MKRIIVAVDRSAEAENALIYAANAAVERQYELTLFSAQYISIHSLHSRLPARELNADLRAKEKWLKDKAAQIENDFGVTTHSYFVSGSFFEELQACIEDTRADMVVMGMAEKSLEQDMLGNTTTAAINRLKIPVLAIPLKAVYQGIKNIVFACDMARAIEQEVLQKVHDIAAESGARVEVFNVNKAVEDLSRYAVDIESSMQGITYYYNSVASSDIISAIKKEVQDQNADLLIMVPYKYGFWGSLVHKSKTRVMASGSNVPLLSISI